MLYIGMDKYWDFKVILKEFIKTSKVVTIIFKIPVKERNSNMGCDCNN